MGAVAVAVADADVALRGLGLKTAATSIPGRDGRGRRGRAKIRVKLLTISCAEDDIAVLCRQRLRTKGTGREKGREPLEAGKLAATVT